MEFGETLRRTREEKGLSVSELAAKTHLLAHQIEGLENEDFSRIAAPIYGRGFVKLYCTALGLDPKPFVDEFMEIYSGNRAPTIRLREHRSRPAPAPMPASAPAMPPPAATATPGPVPAETPPAAEPLFPGHSPTEPFSAQPAASAPAAPAPFDPGFSLEADVVPSVPPPPPVPPAPRENPFRVPQRPRRLAPPPGGDFGDGRSFSIPPAFWRFALLGVLAFAVLWALVAGIRAIYSAATDAPANSAPAAENAAPAAESAPGGTAAGTSARPAPAAAPSQRTPVKIPPLYID